MAINHNINAEDNSLVEIEDQIVKAGADIATVKVEENKVFAQEKQESGFEAGQESGAIGSASTIGSNRVDVAIDAATEAMGLPSLELAGAICKVAGDRGGLFDSVKKSMDGKAFGYGGKNSGGIKTAHFNDIAARADCIQDFTNSGIKGVQASKGSAPSMKHEKALVMGQRMAHEQTFHAAMAAKQKFTAPGMGGGAVSGAKPMTLEKFMVPKGYVDPEELKWKDEHENRDIWGSGETTA